MTARAAIYYAPRQDDPLWAAGASWLGRDPATNAAAPIPADRAPLVFDPQTYGFHATLKPPMRLAQGWDRFLADAEALAARLPAFDLPRLSVENLHGFLALRETEPCPALQALADACVKDLDQHRVPPDEAELARRRRNTLTEAQDAMLVRWGYPYVFGTWFFHMTLSRRLSQAEHAIWQEEAERHFADSLALGRRVTDICIFTQPAPGRPFTLAARLPLRD